MMMCNDNMSGGLPTAAAAAAAAAGPNGQSQCQMGAQPVNVKTRDQFLESASADIRLSATRPSSCVGDSRPRKTVTPNSQGDWHLNYAEHRLRSVEPPTNPRSEVSDATSSRTEKVNRSPMNVAVSVAPSSPAEMRQMKRMADYTNSPSMSHVAKKRMKLDANPTAFDPDPVDQPNILAQEHWKKGAVGYFPKEVLPSHASREKTMSSKEGLSQHLNHLDSLIVHHDMTLARLHTTLERLEEAMPKPGEDGGNLEKEPEDLEMKPQLSQAERLLAENRHKAETSHSFLNKTRLLTESFLYQRPSDTAVYHENKHKFMAFKKRLFTFLKNKHEAQNTRMETLKKQYNSLQVAWRRKMEAVENEQKQSARKLREYFDKIFPDMKKQEEEKLQRYCSTVLPSAEVDGSNKEQKDVANKHEIQMEKVMEKLRSLAAQPTPLLDSNSRRPCFLNENGFIGDPASVNSASMLKCSFWTEPERDLFLEKYVRHPKKFGLIASFLENKSVQDCVQFYYLTKKAVGYKKLQRQKYSRKPKIRGANNAKEDKAENKNSGIHPCRERLPPSGFLSTAAAEPRNRVELEQSEEPLLPLSVETDSVKQIADGGSVEPSSICSSAIPPESSLGRLNPPSPEEEEEKNLLPGFAEDVTRPLTSCGNRAISVSDRLDSVAESYRSQSPPKESSEPVQDMCKAEDDDSIATLSADEGGAHSQDDEDRNASEDAPTLVPSFPAQILATAEPMSRNKSLSTGRLSCRSDFNPDAMFSNTSQLDTEEVLLRKSQPSVGQEGSRYKACQPSVSQEGNRYKASMTTASPVSASETRSFVKPGNELDERSKGMPDLLPLGFGARGTSPQVRSPSVGNRSGGDSRVVLPVAGRSSFVRNSGSPARIRDLIHAAIEKNLQVTDCKSSDAATNAKRHVDTMKFKSSSDIAYKPPSTSVSAPENQAEDLSVRHPYHMSSRAETCGKVLAPQNMPCQPLSVNSPYHLRPAHSHDSSSQPDPRSGYLLELAIVAEYDNMKRSERDSRKDMLERGPRKDFYDRDFVKEAFEREPQKEAFERDLRKETVERDSRKASFEREAHSGRFDSMPAVDPAVQTMRRRDNLLHRGSIMQGTPIPTSQLHASPFHAEALVERFGVPGHNPAVPTEPTSWRPHHPIVPHISSEHMKLLCDDFRTAQQLRIMQEEPPRVEPNDRPLQSYSSYQNMLRGAFSGQSDTRMPLYQSSKADAFPGGIPPSWQHHTARSGESQNYVSEVARGSGQRSLASNRADGGGHIVPSMPLGNGSVATTRGSCLPEKRTSESLATSQWQLPPTAPESAKSAKDWVSQPEQKNWPKISDGCSAAQLIEWIISIQISQPDASEKGTPSSILNRLDETSAASLSESLGLSNMPPKLWPRSDELRAERDVASTAPRIQEKAATSSGRVSDRGFPLTGAVSESGLSSRSEIPDRGFSSGMRINDQVLPSVVDVPKRTLSSGIYGVVGGGANKSDSNLTNRAAAIESCFETIFKDLGRETMSQNSSDGSRNAMRTFLAGSDPASYEDVQKTDIPRSSSGLNQSRVATPRVSTPARIEGSSSSTEHPSEKTAPVFNWKTKILWEHQKQQRENEDRDLPSVASPSSKSGDQENKSNERQQLRRLSSSDLSTQSNGDVTSAASRPDGATVLASTASKLSSPGEGSQPVGTASDDHESPIAGKHQMISTLLSSKSGRRPGRTVALSASSSSSSGSSSSSAAAAAAGPVPSDPQLSRQTVARDSSTLCAPCDRTDKTDPCPAPGGSESPESDSPEPDLPGRLCIRLDSAEDLKSPSPDS